MNIPPVFAKSCWINWYRGHRVAAKDGAKYDSWEKFWNRRLRAIEDYYRY